jgi:hypothetical protein
MTIVIVRPVAAWSDFGHSEFEACGARVFLRSNQSSSATPFAVRDQIGRLLGSLLGRLLRGCRQRGNSAGEVIGEATGRGMKRIGIVIANIAFIFASAANAQSVSGRVTSTVGEVGSVAGQAAVGAGPSGSQASGSTNLPNSSLLGGELPGGVKVKLGDKVINLRGNVGVGDNGGNFKAGVPF